ncbi:pyridoxal phosphate-dependent decarboxylase family protein [Limibacillus halophilus]|uniref:Glutamate/tyrosine decarboxylase-like PLP-dependent enzyme n=1 Tax=Limibacillus halophilus TaxID=1579333 RepID=A0A839SPF5_9PROT|nr:aminotransferase class V-fold PLP-dependent enzyme [Limibacillus halophilus]MBB3064322.1 glutamate/tyrosine decarboxylase-like PLP-dependent enzyme [Limibacillus halophilus]
MDHRLPPSEETLDPVDWTGVERVAMHVVADSVRYLAERRERPVWQAMPDNVRRRFEIPAPTDPTPLEEVIREVQETIMPYPMGNVHPHFWSWFMGSGSFTGALAEFLAAIQGSNVGGGDHAAVYVDRQVVDWLRGMVGMPASAEGTLVSGGSAANLVGLTVARNVKAGIDVREAGVAAMPRPLRFYGSDQIHSCHRKAVEALGLGNRALRRIPSDAAFRIDLSALRAAIAEDRASGLRPACLIANAGSVNTGAIDDLMALADLAAAEDMWLHVDGCIGALLAIAPENAPLVVGLARADSLALDPHKWLHAPFGIGCALIRKPGLLGQSFATMPEYLETAPRGLASGPWLHELGPETSRGFRALKVWMMLKEHGLARFGHLIDRNITQARHLADIVETHPRLALAAPQAINIVCFRYDPGGLDAAELKTLNVEIMLRLQESGTAAISDTTLKGAHSLRVAICNHRTRFEDLDHLAAEVVRIGDLVSATG